MPPRNTSRLPRRPEACHYATPSSVFAPLAEVPRVHPTVSASGLLSSTGRLPRMPTDLAPAAEAVVTGPRGDSRSRLRGDGAAARSQQSKSSFTSDCRSARERRPCQTAAISTRACQRVAAGNRRPRWCRPAVATPTPTSTRASMPAAPIPASPHSKPFEGTSTIRTRVCAAPPVGWSTRLSCPRSVGRPAAEPSHRGRRARRVVTHPSKFVHSTLRMHRATAQAKYVPPAWSGTVWWLRGNGHGPARVGGPCCHKGSRRAPGSRRARASQRGGPAPQ